MSLRKSTKFDPNLKENGTIRRTIKITRKIVVWGVRTHFNLNPLLPETQHRGLILLWYYATTLGKARKPMFRWNMFHPHTGCEKC